MEKRKRNIQIKFRVTEEEKQLIEQKMAQLPTRQIGAYLRKMAIDGLIIYTDTTNIKEMNKELHSIGVNINQIAKRVNETGSIYEEDIKEIQERLNKIWQLHRTIRVKPHPNRLTKSESVSLMNCWALNLNTF